MRFLKKKKLKQNKFQLCWFKGYIFLVFFCFQATLLDDTNGNGILIAHPTKTTTNTTVSTLLSSLSTEDLSQSLSEYTDADESMSAPTEFLAEVSCVFF